MKTRGRKDRRAHGRMIIRGKAASMKRAFPCSSSDGSSDVVLGYPDTTHVTMAGDGASVRAAA